MLTAKLTLIIKIILLVGQKNHQKDTVGIKIH